MDMVSALPHRAPSLRWSTAESVHHVWHRLDIRHFSSDPIAHATAIFSGLPLPPAPPADTAGSHSTATDDAQGPRRRLSAIWMLRVSQLERGVQEYDPGAFRREAPASIVPLLEALPPWRECSERITNKRLDQELRSINNGSLTPSNASRYYWQVTSRLPTLRFSGSAYV